jgi:hypothetical protein
MNRFRLMTALAFGVASLAQMPLARADLAPMCPQFDSLTNCAAADVGTACPSGGMCASVQCDTGGVSSTLTKCVECPNVVADPSNTCATAGPAGTGKACGTNGTCAFIPSYCGTEKYACTSAEMGAGGGAGSAGAAGASSTAGSAGSTSTAGSAGAAGSAGSGTCTDNCDPPSSSSGCSIASPVGKRGAFAALMTLAGLAAILRERRKKS